MGSYHPNDVSRMDQKSALKKTGIQLQKTRVMGQSVDALQLIGNCFLPVRRVDGFYAYAFLKKGLLSQNRKFTSIIPLPVLDYTFWARVTSTPRASRNIGGFVLDVIVFGKVLNGCIRPEDGFSEDILSPCEGFALASTCGGKR